MQAEGDVEGARSRFLANRFQNLDVLLEHRYRWMNDWIQADDVLIEIGAGAGFSELYLKKRPTMSDTTKRQWIQLELDALSMDLENESVDCIIASHTIHHFSNPATFFDQCARVLKPKGRVIIQEINTSLAMRALLRLMRHEGWSYEVDIFDRSLVANDPRDPWSANCAIPELLFSDQELFERSNPNFSVAKNDLNECLLFPLSGGVIAKTNVPQLPRGLLNVVARIDKAIVKLLPSIFALGRSVVLIRN
jgi:SAM-dependent methyltransferase